MTKAAVAKARVGETAHPGTVLVLVRAGGSVTSGDGTYGPGSVLRVPLEEADYLFGAGAAVPASIGPPDWSHLPKGPGFCGPSTVRCASATGPDKYKTERAPCCHAIVTELVRYIGEMLDTYGVTWWADYGTLLGAVRHGGMIPWDKDADLGVLASQLDRVLVMEHAARAVGLGFSFSRNETVKFTCSPLNKTNLDIFPWSRRINDWLYRKHYVSVDRFKGKEIKTSLLFPLQRIPYEDFEVWAPRDPEAFLAMRYGPDWRTPVHANNDGKVRR